LLERNATETKGDLMKPKKLLFKEVGKDVSYRVLSVNPVIEEISGKGEGRIGSLRFRSIWTHRNFIGKGVKDRTVGSGILFVVNVKPLPII